MANVTIGDATLHYEITGSGPPMMLLAGMLSDSASWGPVVPALSEHYTVIRPDNRLTGRTTPPIAEAGPVIYAQDALALLDHLKLSKAHIVGHSMGGLIGLEMASIAPDRLTSLTLAGTAPMRSPRVISWFDTVLELRRTAPEGLWLRALLTWLFTPEVYADTKHIETAVAAGLAYPHAQNLDQMAAQIESLRSYRPTGKLSDLRLPVQAILGADDMLIPAGPATKALKAIPNLTLEVIETAGHSIHWDQPERFVQCLTTFRKDIA